MNFKVSIMYFNVLIQVDGANMECAAIGSDYCPPSVKMPLWDAIESTLNASNSVCRP